MTKNTEKLVGLPLLNAFMGWVDETGTTSDAGVSAVAAFAPTAGFETALECQDLLIKAHRFIQLSNEEPEVFFGTFDRDLQTFCSKAFAAVVLQYNHSFKGFELSQEYLNFVDEARMEWTAAYQRLVQTEHGIQVVVLVRNLVTAWFAKWGNPDVGDFFERQEILLRHWDQFEMEACGVNGQHTAVELVDTTAANSASYTKTLGRVLGMVMATDAYYADNEGDTTALLGWRIDEDLYNKDVAYASRELKFLADPERTPFMFDAVLETFIPLIGLSQRFKSITGLWAVKRLLELSQMEAASEEVAAK